jgi:hypothetical protein
MLILWIVGSHDEIFLVSKPFLLIILESLGGSVMYLISYSPKTRNAKAEHCINDLYIEIKDHRDIFLIKTQLL